MLKGIPQIISPELLKVLCEMGHSDRIVIADGNFPNETRPAEWRITVSCRSIPEAVSRVVSLSC